MMNVPTYLSIEVLPMLLLSLSGGSSELNNPTAQDCGLTGLTGLTGMTRMTGMTELLRMVVRLVYTYRLRENQRNFRSHGSHLAEMIPYAKLHVGALCLKAIGIQEATK